MTLTLTPRTRKWRDDLPPVDTPVRPRVDELDPTQRTVGVTFMRTHDRCDRAAYLDLKHDGGPGSHALNRGAVFHVFAAKAVNWIREHDEHRIDPETAKDLMLEAMRENRHLTVPAFERDALRGMAYNFAEGTYFEPHTIVGVEQMIELPIGDYLLRGRIDLIEQPHYGRIDVTDYKTSFDVPTAAEWNGDYQTYLYALLLAFGTVDGMSLAPGVEDFRVKLAFPRYLNDDGLATRSADPITRPMLTDLKFDLEEQLERLDASFESGRWPAVPGDHCSECVSPNECPLPRYLRPWSQFDHDATIEQVEKAAEWWDKQGERVRQVKARIKKWADQHGRRTVQIGETKELAFVETQKSKSIDREQLAVEVQGAVEYGHPIDLDKLSEKTVSVEFKPRKIPKPDEVES